MYYIVGQLLYSKRDEHILCNRSIQNLRSILSIFWARKVGGGVVDREKKITPPPPLYQVDTRRECSPVLLLCPHFNILLCRCFDEPAHVCMYFYAIKHRIRD